MGTYALLAIGLLIVGVLILVAEVFLPSGGLLGALTAVILVASIVCAWYAWGRTNLNLFLSFILCLLIIVPGAVVGAFRVLPNTRFGRHVLLEAPALEQVEPFVAETARLERYIGRVGQALTLLNPGGLIDLDGERLHAHSEGMVIEPQSSVKVLEVRGTRLLVRQVARGDRPESPTQASVADGFDFDVPQDSA